MNQHKNSDRKDYPSLEWARHVPRRVINFYLGWILHFNVLTGFVFWMEK